MMTSSHSKAKLDYPYIGSDLHPIAAILDDHNFADTSSDSLSLDETLAILSVGELQDLRKAMGLGPPQVPRKEGLIAWLLKHAKGSVKLHNGPSATAPGCNFLNCVWLASGLLMCVSIY